MGEQTVTIKPSTMSTNVMIIRAQLNELVGFARLNDASSAYEQIDKIKERLDYIGSNLIPVDNPALG